MTRDIEYDASADIEFGLKPWDQMLDEVVKDKPRTIYMRFNPRCRECKMSLKKPEYQSVVLDPIPESPTYQHVIRREFLCPYCNIKTTYTTMDFSNALKRIFSLHVTNFSIVIDPFLSLQWPDAEDMR